MRRSRSSPSIRRCSVTKQRSLSFAQRMILTIVGSKDNIAGAERRWPQQFRSLEERGLILRRGEQWFLTESGTKEYIEITGEGLDPNE